jgi:hypothetical protein
MIVPSEFQVNEGLIMRALFGYRVEPNFSLAKEERRTRAVWGLLGGGFLWVFYLFSGLPFATQVIQGYVSTLLFFGFGFYYTWGDHLGKMWVWKAVSLITPIHVLYVALIFWSDKRYPDVMTKPLVFVPILSVAYAFEAIFFDWIVNRFKPSGTDQEAMPTPPSE